VIAHLQTRLETLYGQERRRNKLGLDGTRALLSALGDPHTKFRSVHVAGTNGKGTVCALIERVLRESGYRTGLYTSPHLVDFRERIRVSGQWADEAWLDEKLSLIENLPEGRDRTFFEVATALGFLYFAEKGVEIAVVEVGLGGRLDCTNVLTPEVSVITTIGFDHTEILGETLEEIAREKAGIIKPGVPVVLPDAEESAVAAIEAVALERGATIAARVPQEVVLDPGRECGRDADADGQLDSLPRTEHRTPWGEVVWGEAYELGEFMQPNARARNGGQALSALAVLLQRGFSIPYRAVTTGFTVARWPGRGEYCPTQPRLWWDAAHNAHGFHELEWEWHRSHAMIPGREMRYEFRFPGTIVLALSRDKDVVGILAELKRAFKSSRLIVTRSRGGRAMDPEVIARAADGQGMEARVVPDVVTAVRVALDSAGDADVLLCGSIFAIGEAMEVFGGAPGEWL
jgi:dihydrofolate synthase / folylpolyglutamate synthase